MCPKGEIFPGASIAAVYISSGIRVYFQDAYGLVRESRWENAGWRGGAYQDILFPAKVGTPLAATTLSDSSIRIYYLDRDGNLQEHCWDGGNWFKGGFGAVPKLMHCPQTRLAATSYNLDGLHIRVYYQTAAGAIQEHCYDPSVGWFTGASLPIGLQGSSIAVVLGHVFFQDCQGWVHEYIYSSDELEWTEGIFSFETPHHTPLAAVSWTSPRGFQMRLNYRSFSNEVVEVAFVHNVWQPHFGQLVSCISNSQLAATQIPNGASKASRIYYQKDQMQLQEHSWVGTSWKVGSVIPTGALG